MTIQNLYTQYLDGKITQSKFLYEARRDQNLDMISSNNSFDDVVKILKNKSIISEKAHKEAKLATGKQEVEVIAKTIDMVNPYEYTRGMEFELNIMDVPATSGDLSEDSILKAQKKVLANLTKNPQYYYEKLNGKGEVSEDWIEVTKKEIEKIGKGKAVKGLMREGYTPNQKVTFTNKNDGNKYTGTVIRDLGNGRFTFKADQDGKTYSTDGMGSNWVINETSRPGYHPDGTPKSNEEMSDDEREAFYNDSDFLDEGAINSDYKYIYKVLKNKYPEIIGNWDIVKSFVDMHIDDIEITDKNSIIQEFENYLSVNPEILNLDEHGQYADRVADVNADSTPLKEKRLRIYEKYAQKMNKTIDEIKCMVDEAIALKDKAGNIQYAKDSTEASTIEKNAKSKGITLTKTAV
jgi:hypothetical protein